MVGDGSELLVALCFRQGFEHFPSQKPWRPRAMGPLSIRLRQEVGVFKKVLVWISCCLRKPQATYLLDLYFSPCLVSIPRALHDDLQDLLT